jgi:hypothetical protein
MTTDTLTPSRNGTGIAHCILESYLVSFTLPAERGEITIDWMTWADQIDAMTKKVQAAKQSHFDLLKLIQTDLKAETGHDLTLGEVDGIRHEVRKLYLQKKTKEDADLAAILGLPSSTASTPAN